MSESQAIICQNCKQNFVIEPEDFDFYAKIKVPPPTWCPECRLIRRLSWRNMRTLYRRPCNLCKKDVIGVYAPDRQFVVYCSKCWWSDAWDGMQYGREYDFSRPFFAQFADLLKTVPLINRFVLEDTMVNSDYTNMASHLKDCYLTFDSGGKTAPCEKCLYSEHLSLATDCVDVGHVDNSQLCNQSVGLSKCYKVFYSKDCDSCRNSYFLSNCTDCDSCFGCANLRNKKYYILNKPYSKEEYFAELKKFGFIPGSYTAIKNLKQLANNVWISALHKYMHESHNKNVSGDYIFDSKNTHSSFDMVGGAEDSKFCTFLIPSVKDCYDFTQYGENAELIYEALQAGEGIYKDYFGWCIWRRTKNSQYGILNISCSDCFGCIGLKNKQYCILNKQYTKEEYEKLVPRVVEHMNIMPFKDIKGRVYGYGEFFPNDICPFAYNETTAQEQFPLSSDDIIAKGYRSADKDKFKKVYSPTRFSSQLPDMIQDTADAVTKEIIACDKCGKPYQILPQELTFYKTNELPLPRICIDCRYEERINMRNPLKLWPRQCQCAGLKSENSTYTNTVSHPHNNVHCPNEFQTSYAPGRPEIVYCGSCYNAEVA